MKGKVFRVVLVCVFFAVAAQAQSFLTIDAAQTKAVFANNQLQTQLVLENRAANLAARVRLEILDADDKILARSESAQNIRRGRQIVSAALVFDEQQSPENLLWHRLRYTIAPDNSAAIVADTLALSEIMPEIFELQISAADEIFAGMNLRAHVAAVHPLTKKPIKNVEVNGAVAIDLETDDEDDEIKIEAKGRTNSEGFATLDFKIPAGVKINDGEIKIRAEKNGIARTAEEDLDASADSFVYLTTDKPIYQPAQKLFVRALYLDPLKRPLAERDLDVEIADEDGETVYETSVKTSRFGVAHFDWQIPENFKLGKYTIEVENDEDTIGASEFKVTRYDLPNFTVQAKSAKTFYLPGENSAQIAVSAEYLFGKPVAKGKVKIVREKTRRWNYERQEYETETGETIEGETSADGKFVAAVDLSEAQRDLQKDEWKRFEDVKFAAYLTDATTNRTEQKRFDVRLSKEAIHIYFIRPAADANRKMPFQFYVSTFYADGTPARCDLKIRGFYENAETPEGSLAAAKTNRYGASKLEINIPEKPFAEAKDAFHLRITANDGRGNSGTFADNLDVDDSQKQIRVSTAKTVYAPNEGIAAEFFSTETERMIFVDVLKNSSVVYSKQLRISENGRASWQIPFRPDFQGELTIAAYFNAEDGYRTYVAHSKTVLFPAAKNLNFNLKSLKNFYRPNEDARISFNVQSGEKTPLETALGVVILDKAIEERAQIEQLPDNYKNLRRLLGSADAFGNLTRRDLDDLDASQPIDGDLQLAAEFLLVNKTFEPNFFASESYAENFQQIYQNNLREKIEPLEKVLTAHYEKTGDYPQDEISLRRILATAGINFDGVRDAWNEPFRAAFATQNAFTILSLKTASADKKFGTADDFAAAEMRFQWFAKRQSELNVILNNYLSEKESPLPQTPEQLKNVWRQNGFDVDGLRDQWNRPFYFETARYNRNSQEIAPETVGNLDGEKQQIFRAKTVAQEILVFKLRSAGDDGEKSARDDFDVAAFTVVLSEKDLSTDSSAPKTKISKDKFASASGAVGGTLFDANGAVIPGATATAKNQNGAEEFSIKSDENGEFLLTNLPSGKYKISVEAMGFQRYVIENVVVSAMNLIRLEIHLEVAGVSSTVEVAADAAMVIDATNSSVTATKSEAKSIADALKMDKTAENFTPRVREYFPETLLWSPELITDKNGRAALDFKLGDNLTTWKLYAVGSTETGEISLLEREFQTFQPFFAELDPPRVLTEGDEIALPVPVRNYTDKKQKVAVAMSENNWSQILNGAAQTLEIGANSAQNAIFNFRAVAAVQNGRQKVSALAKKDADAIEKTVTVVPNGKPETTAQSKIFQTGTFFDLNFPADAFAANRRAEIKIYPNMLAHVAESVEGLLKRPYGCGEQTTSSTYPNLLILKIEKELGKSVDAKIKARAQIYLADGYRRLLNYQTPSGGFSYWGKSDAPDAALTAYVLRFLTDAKPYLALDENVYENARGWLAQQQQPNGSWKSSGASDLSVTAYVARSLTLSGESGDTEKSLRGASEFLQKRLPEIADSFVLANAALAAVEIGDAKTARQALEKLETLPETEKNSFFWKTADTPFHGWGRAAEIETTALVVQAFAKFQNLNSEEKIKRTDEFISKGAMFLLENKDEFGVWHSTQTTVNVLDALILLQKTNSAAGKTEKVEIFINGAKAQEIFVSDDGLKNPFVFDASAFLTKPENRIEIKNAGNANLTTAQTVARFYTNWENAKPDAKYFDFKIEYDKISAKIGEEIECRVRAAKNYSQSGMILTEIGLPPGADVDRAALENAKTRGVFSSFDILPEKIVIYSRTNNERMDFSFKFRPRYAINAQTAPSVVYDYYNDEARAILAPVKFSVK